MECRVAAVLAADMVGYSRLIERDELGTLERQKGHLRALIRPAIAERHGRIVKLTGDGLIAEFTSVVEAVQCALAIQEAMVAREADQPEAERIVYRVAIHLGDLVFDEGDVYGDGVNIAARLEALAVPGGVVVSGTAYDVLKANVEVAYQYLGEKHLKNIATPVRVYQVVAGLPDEPPSSRMLSDAAQRAVRALRTYAPDARVDRAGNDWAEVSGLSPAVALVERLDPALAEALERGLLSGATEGSGVMADLAESTPGAQHGRVWRLRATGGRVPRSTITPARTVDAREKPRDGGVVDAMRAMTDLQPGEVLEVLARGPGSPAAFARWADRAGHALVAVERAQDAQGRAAIRLLIEKA